MLIRIRNEKAVTFTRKEVSFIQKAIEEMHERHVKLIEEYKVIPEDELNIERGIIAKLTVIEDRPIDNPNTVVLREQLYS